MPISLPQIHCPEDSPHCSPEPSQGLGPGGFCLLHLQKEASQGEREGGEGSGMVWESLGSSVEVAEREAQAAQWCQARAPGCPRPCRDTQTSLRAPLEFKAVRHVLWVKS